MKYGLSERAIRKIVGVFVSNPNIEEAVIYGSRAMGTYREGSDIDITLKGENLTFKDILHIENQLDDEMLPYTFDISLYQKLDNKELVDHIRRIGRALYIKGKKQ